MTVPIYLMLDTWNAIGTTFNAIYMNISNGAGGAPVGAAASRAFRLDANSSSIFDITIGGAVTALGQFNGSGFKANGAGIDVNGTLNGTVIGSTSSLFFVSTTNLLSGTPDVILARDAANTLALRNGVNAQQFSIYQTFTDASNYGRLAILWNSGSSVYQIIPQFAGTGSANVDIQIGGISGGGQNGAQLTVYASGQFIFARAGIANYWQIDTAAGNFVPLNDNTRDIGDTTHGIKNLFVTGYARNFGRTIASLPTAASAGAGAHMFVTDALAPAFGVTIAAGGAANSPVYSDGTNWKGG